VVIAVIRPGYNELVQIRNATRNDAHDLAYLINLAGENLPEFHWRHMAGKGRDPLAFGAQRAARESGAFSYRNARVLELDGAVAGMELSYRLPDVYDPGELDDLPEVIHPLVHLEAEAPGSWYINAIATYESFRGRGVASKLMSGCETLSREAGASGISLIVSSENRGAHALYLKLGYREVASRPIITYPGGPAGGAWLLMVKPL
jgi:ribosomal protein S18 acetylase RimI-like enzyme